jgi:release factor glutamine methyltransferase
MPVSSPHVRTAVVSLLQAGGCVYADEEAGLLIDAATSTAALTAMVQRRVSGVPLEQILGWVAFCGLRVAVEPGVFVPRRRTELLVQQAAALLTAGAVVVDLCCGSGAVGAALAADTFRPAGAWLDLHASDVDPVACRCAQRNLIGRGSVHRGDLYEPLPGRLRARVDVVVANAPYVPTAAIPFMPAEARVHEPLSALDGGPDGMEVQRRVIAEAPAWLVAGGHLLVETSEQQAAATCESFAAAGLFPRVVRSDDLDATVVIGAAAGHAGAGR